MIETSASIAAIGKALVLAQGLVKGAEKDSKNPAFKSNYASLESVIDAARPALQKAGIAFTQAPGAVNDNGSLEITTMLVHGDSGEWMRSTLHVVLGKRDPQGIGSAITYGCRYSLMSVLGIPPVDDDGEGAKETRPQLSSYRAKQIINTQAIVDEIDKATTEKRADELDKLIRGELYFLPSPWIKAFLERLDAQRDTIRKGGVIEEPKHEGGAAMDQAFADTIGGVDTKSMLTRSVAMEDMATKLKACKSAEAMGRLYDTEIEGKFEGDAKNYLLSVYDEKLREFVAVE